MSATAKTTMIAVKRRKNRSPARRLGRPAAEAVDRIDARALASRAVLPHPEEQYDGPGR